MVTAVEAVVAARWQAGAIEEELDALGAQHAELDGLLAGLDGEGWATPSRCDGWSVSDVVLHLAQTDEMAVASLEDRFDAHLESLADAWGGATDVDDGAGRLVAAERGGQSPAEVHARWREGAARLRSGLAARADGDRVPWVAGQLAARTLAVTRLSECWIHSGDVAYGLGVDLVPTDRLRLVARLAWRTLPYAFVRAGEEPPGPVAFHLTGPSGDEWRFDPAGPSSERSTGSGGTPDGPSSAAGLTGSVGPAGGVGPTGGGEVTVVRGPALDLCLVAGQRAAAADTTLNAEGPAAERVLALVRTFA